MDPHVRWLRGRITKSVATLILVWLAVAIALSLALLATLMSNRWLDALPWALVLAQVIVAGGLIRAFLSNPLSYSYFRSQEGEPPRFGLSSELVESSPAERFARHQLVPLVTLDDASTGEVAFDLFQTPRRTATVARHRRSGSVSIVSRLVDDRLVVTDSVLAVPHRRLVANRADGDKLNDLIDAHRQAVDAQRELGFDAIEDDGFSFIEALALEHESLSELGPLLGPFLNLGRGSAPLRFLTQLDLSGLPEVSEARAAARLELVGRKPSQLVVH